jgi:integrase
MRIGLCDRVHGNVCDREQQTVRAFDESLHPEVSLVSGVRRPTARCDQDASDRSLESELGKPFTQSAIEAALRFGCKRAGLRIIGSHVLRHTFRSHLAMRGAAPRAIQELVGHSTLSMTLRYMHLAPSALCEAIGLLNFGQPVGSAQSAAV